MLGKKKLIELCIKQKCLLIQLDLARNGLTFSFREAVMCVLVKGFQHFRTGANVICRFPYLLFRYALNGTRPVLSDKNGTSSAAISTILPVLFFFGNSLLDNLHLIPF